MVTAALEIGSPFCPAAVQPALFALPRWQEGWDILFSLHKTFKIMHVYIVCHAVFIYNNTSVFLR